MDSSIFELANTAARGVGRSAGVVVAVSGGADSVALVRLLHAIREEHDLRLSVAHLDHGTRGEAAREDAAFVEDLAAKLGLPFDLGHWSPSRAAHFEADARKARYAWLAQVARERSAERVAVAHTRDDQAETILHRIVRGTGLRGLAGMPERRTLGDGVTIVRPLLDVSRSSLRAYLATIGQIFREDATNADLSRTRNRIRHDLLPKIAAGYNPRIVEALAQLGRIAGEAHEPTERLARDAIVLAQGREIVLDGEALVPLPVSSRAEVLRTAWRRAGWPEAAMAARHWLAIARLVDRPGSRLTTAYAVDAVHDGGLLRLSRPEARGHVVEPPVRLPIPGSAEWGGRTIVASENAGAPHDERIDRDRLALLDAPGLEIRGARDGDRFDPLGLDGHEQGLNDFFRGRGVPPAERSRVPLVCDARGIVWVVGHRIAHRARITPETRAEVRLRAHN